ncbi:MAG: methionine gamma-lyase family protein [Lachnospiraceae bacterium]|nr:methionine gamma-lyase family protein [Lachnospiraceae bacterium]
MRYGTYSTAIRRRKNNPLEETHTIQDIYQKINISPRIVRFGEQVLEGLQSRFLSIAGTAEYNSLKVLNAFHAAKVSEAHLTGTTGYGYGDIGRDTLEEVYSHIFATEDALVRPQIASGTHALQIAMMGILRPGDILYSPAGKPYDTLEEVIGIRPSDGSLREFGIGYLETPLTKEGRFDYPAIEEALGEKRIRLVTIQRSKGYQTRPSFSVRKLGELIAHIKRLRDDVVIMVDNCYGEFVDRTEPAEAGADLVVGSLIKNPGGGLAPSGGYICGKKDLVARVAHRLTSPGLGKEVGASLTVLRSYYQGLFLAPSVVSNAVRGAIFAAALYEELNTRLSLNILPYPSSDTPRHDIIQAITFPDARLLSLFCEGIQQASPVDAHVRPQAWAMPGYDDDVIMAAGTFISGSSIELSADGPVRPPYTVYFQGGLTWPHVKYGILNTVQKLADFGIFDPKSIQ